MTRVRAARRVRRPGRPHAAVDTPENDRHDEKPRARENNRKAVLRSLYGAVEHDRPGAGGSELRAESGLPGEASPPPASTWPTRA
ncbi:hypothetical protein GCM10011578_033130 [Streptomyces fuscichromogenes]|uniref:Uncharacterized protein n=1 Tax=Streptomyces fuscichromogenes TaxID=1324013 RepID=A0A918CRF3_9ACTN|nr:hypothetical protein GCM10011578_033130 [Streptomyces fuscichromogenes]